MQPHRHQCAAGLMVLHHLTFLLSTEFSGFSSSLTQNSLKPVRDVDPRWSRDPQILRHHTTVVCVTSSITVLA
jgi:hypothetical protein